jgi:tripartite-type tricarboxylate transporter receptor subunit TctC
MKLVNFIVLCLGAWNLQAQTITLTSPYGPGHFTTPPIYPILEVANQSQSKYNFILELKPGGNGTVNVRYMDQSPETRLSIIAPAHVENIDSGELQETNYVPVSGLGDACVGVFVRNDSVFKKTELIVGGVGFGNAAHLTGLSIADKFNQTSRYIPFKTNLDAFVNLGQEGGIDITTERVLTHSTLRSKLPNIKVYAVNCPVRLTESPDTPTLTELGYKVPTVWNIFIANKAMTTERRTELARILDQAILKVGAAKIKELSDLRPPVFDNQNIQSFYNSRIETHRLVLKKYKTKVESDKNYK